MRNYCPIAQPDVQIANWPPGYITGKLSFEIVPLSSIEAANKEVESIISQVEKSSSENDQQAKVA